MKKTNNKKRVALYLRVSGEEQKKEGLSLSAQLRTLQEYCEFKKWEVFKVYKDEGISGHLINKRPQFKQLLEDSNQNKFSTILITKFDRAFRNTKEALITLDDLKEKKIDFVSIKEDIDTTNPMGKFFFIIISAFSELERNMTLDRNKDIMRDKFKRGLMVGRSPFGYKTMLKGKKVMRFKINQKEAEIVKTIYNLKSEGKSIVEIAKSFNMGYQSIKNILENKAYIGVITFEGKVMEGLHEKIISRELWEKCQKK